MTTNPRQADRLDTDQVADLVLPLDGPHDPEAIVNAARTVAELVRRLNHATLSRAALRYPSQIYSVVGGLSAGVSGLDQTLRQLAARLDRWATDPRIGHDRGLAPLTTCVGAADHLRLAAAELVAVSARLDTAHALTSHLNLDESDHAARQAFPPIAVFSPLTPSPAAQPPLPDSNPGRAR